MKKQLIAVFVSTLCVVFASVGVAQKKLTPWTEWSKKDAQKILDDSGWGQTQVETDTSELFYQPTARGGVNAGQRDSEGATNQATSVKYHLRFFSARPVRMALVRLIELGQAGQLDAATDARLKNFAELSSDYSIIVTATYESGDQRFANRVMQGFNSATAATLKNNTYLERNDGKRLFVGEYAPPGRDGFGARFIFPRTVDGQPFLTPDAGEVRFFSEVDKSVKLNMRFKLAAMMYEGRLEY